jgi:phosphoglycerate dehydrogenase-like enzyme
MGRGPCNLGMTDPSGCKRAERVYRMSKLSQKRLKVDINTRHLPENPNTRNFIHTRAFIFPMIGVGTSDYLPKHH